MRHGITALAALIALALAPGICRAQAPVDGAAAATPPASTASASTAAEDDISCGPSE